MGGINEQTSSSKPLDASGGKTVLDWMKDCNFYLHGVVYTMVRVAMVVTVSMQPFYLTTVLGFETTEEKPTPTQLALVPLLSYCSSQIFTLFVQQKMTRCLRNRFLPLLLGIFVITVSSAPMFFLDNQYRNFIYPLSAIQGIGMAIMLNTATSLISDVVGNDSKNSAFVYGTYSFSEKNINGALLFWMISQYVDEGDDTSDN
jgi:Na+/melibiose symporter-like transporter